MALEREKSTFDRELPALLQNPDNVGKFALLHGDRVDSVWPTLEKALEAGYERFGLDTFLVRRVVLKEEPLYFSHNVTPCPS